MTRSAYMTASASILSDKCFRWAPCPPWLCKCTSGTGDYKNNYGGIWQGACLSANSPTLISNQYEISPIQLETSATFPLSWYPITKYCCVNDLSNKLITTLNLIDMICPYIGLPFGSENSYNWYNIESSLNFVKTENSGNISDASVGQVFNHKAFGNGYKKYTVKMSCKGLSNEEPSFCKHYKSGNISPSPIPTAPPTPAPNPRPPTPGSSGTYTVLSGDTCTLILSKLCQVPSPQCSRCSYSEAVCPSPAQSCKYLCNKKCSSLYGDISYDCTGMNHNCPAPSPTYNYCGTKFSTASCNYGCPSGNDSECPSGLSCFRSVTTCPTNPPSSS